MKAYKVTTVVIDRDDLGADKIKAVIEHTKYPNRCISPEVIDTEAVDIGEWSDNHPLNRTATRDAALKALFNVK